MFNKLNLQTPTKAEHPPQQKQHPYELKIQETAWVVTPWESGSAIIEFVPKICVIDNSLP